MTSEQQASVGTCRTCGKQCFLTKKDAKREARRVPSRRNRITAYQCGDYWHFGKLPVEVVAGRRAPALTWAQQHRASRAGAPRTCRSCRNSRQTRRPRRSVPPTTPESDRGQPPGGEPA